MGLPARRWEEGLIRLALVMAGAAHPGGGGGAEERGAARCSWRWQRIKARKINKVAEPRAVSGCTSVPSSVVVCRDTVCHATGGCGPRSVRRWYYSM